MGGGPNAPERHHSPHLVIIAPFPEPQATLAALRYAHPNLHITFFDQSTWPTVPSSLYKSATILCTWSLLPQDPRVDTPHLKWIHILSVKTKWLEKHAVCRDALPVAITTSRGAGALQAARWALSTWLSHEHKRSMLQTLRNFHEPFLHNDMIASCSDHNGTVGKRLGILGYGSVGRQVGRLAKDLGIDVVVCTFGEEQTLNDRRHRDYTARETGDAKATIPVEWLAGTDVRNFHEFLRAELDWLVVTLPISASTQNILGAEEFEILSRKRAFVSIVANGPIFSHNDLVAALRVGAIRGAALKLTDGLNLKKSSPLWEMSNVTVAPQHDLDDVLGLQHAFDILGVNLARFERGEKLLYLMNSRQ